MEGSADSVNFLTGAAVQIREAYRAADQVWRATIVARIQAVRWLPYADVPAA
jgi:hypothetical protein